MMRRLTTLVALAVALAASTSEAARPSTKAPAGGKPTVTKIQTQKSGGSKPAPGKVAAPKSSTVKTTSPSGSKAVKPAKTAPQLAGGSSQTKSPKSPSQKSVKSDTRMAKADTNAKGPKTDAKSTRAEARTAKSGSTTTAPTTERTRSLTSPGTAAPAVDFTATKVGQKLENNSALRSKIEARLQAAGYTGTAYEAGYGFKNVGQLNAATNMVQNHGTSFELLKVLMTGTYVDPVTHNVYRTQKLPDGTTQLVKPELATNTAPTLSLGQAKQAITGGAVMPEIVPYTATRPATTTTSSRTSTTSTAGTASVTTTTGKVKPRKHTTATTQPGGGF
jgi:hypothetical protein